MRILRWLIMVAGVVALLACALLLYARFVEPRWVKVRTVRLSADAPTCRLVQISDLHYRGDRWYLRRVVRIINRLAPDAVCLTGDIVDDRTYLTEALAILRTIERPVYGVPGNHEYWSGASFPEIAAALEATGGQWLVDASQPTPDGRLRIFGMVQHTPPAGVAEPGRKRVLLMHYPTSVKWLAGRRFDVILAGHTHGGQVRIPFWGPVLTLAISPHLSPLDRGLSRTAFGPLYVNPGLGTYPVPIRFYCRPEITVIEL